MLVGTKASRLDYWPAYSQLTCCATSFTGQATSCMSKGRGQLEVMVEFHICFTVVRVSLSGEVKGCSRSWLQCVEPGRGT